MCPKTPDLDAAYSLEGSEGSRRLYADWAASYDRDFAEAEDYRLHDAVAEAFCAAGGQGPVLDVGAGTGLCGDVLARLGAGPIDALDISPEMLDRAMRKDIYRDAILADLREGVPAPPESYAGIVSAGTFTIGHVGPEGIAPLLRVARRGALFALSINARHFADAGFAAAFDALEGRAISSLRLRDVAIYGPRAQGPHRADAARIALFEKA